MGQLSCSQVLLLPPFGVPPLLAPNNKDCSNAVEFGGCSPPLMYGMCPNHQVLPISGVQRTEAFC